MQGSRGYLRQITTTMPAISWGAVFGGATIGATLFLTLSVLWFAIASPVAGFRTALPWIEAASAVVALFIAGWLAGWMSGVPGVTAGLANGLTVWGLFALTSTFVGTPGVMRVTGVDVASTTVAPVFAIADPVLWAAFWSLLIGAAAAGVGGVMGGGTRTTSTAPPDGPLHDDLAGPDDIDPATRRRHLVDGR